ncbi:bilirubin oxidase [Sphaerisporangium album]|uniref:Bilirubin oxidase n=1 Tax=Sphaerisporangium album TaxID=509200 RepID=A0A367F656_9ACTN|nr:multicopper oxidase [Sphaerisporangium album]RCG25836.1 bilirubin oxidase [Sphaerisporangium album]
MFTRREFLKATIGGTAVLLYDLGRGARPLALLNAREVAKYTMPLAVPPVMPPLAGQGEPVDRYAIGVRRLRQRILPRGHPPTTVWGYGAVQDPRTFASPGFTVEAIAGRPVRVKWSNELVDDDGGYLPHLLPVDPTLHWADPEGGPTGRDRHPGPRQTPGHYGGPVPLVTHLHGGHSADHSDGFPEAWYLPRAGNTPAGYATEGSWYAEFAARYAAAHGGSWSPGSAVFHYRNDQRAATMWYHDHALGITRLNTYAGLAGFYLLRGGPADLPPGVLPGPAPSAGDGGRGPYHEIPIVIQDRSFAADGALFYPGGRAFFDHFHGPYVPRSDIPPIWNPEFFGTAMMVNGRTWPFLEVEPRRFRFRFLNGCNGRVLDLKIVTDPLARRPAPAALPFWHIGSEGGFLPAPVELGRVLIAPAERADVIVDFTGVRPGTELYLINEGPDGAFNGDPHAAPADPSTTGQVMKFVVRDARGPDPSVPPDRLTLPPLTRLGPAGRTRRLALLERDSTVVRGAGPTAVLLGTVDGRGKPSSRMWSDPITENPVVGATEVWEIHNFTPDAHPIHVHEIMFHVLDRRRFDGGPRPPEPWERGYKDTVIAYPHQITRIVAHFDRAGLFVWHCHLLEHEDNEMMRPYRVGT